MKKRCVLLVLCMLVLTGCSEQNEEQSKPIIEDNMETESDIIIEEETVENNEMQAELTAPTKEEVLAMRELVLTGMSEDEKERLTENIKVANLTMESAYIDEDIFGKLEDKESPYWQYFDQKGDIQLGWWYNQEIHSMEQIMRAEKITEEEFHDKFNEPGIAYNRFDGANFIELIQDMQKSVQNESLSADLQQLIDLTNLAMETHEVEYANEIYKILHDLDYFLLRYGIEDVGKYTTDMSVVAKYYGVLIVYENANLNERKLSVEDAWEVLREKYFMDSELNEISYDQQERMQIVVGRGEAQFNVEDNLRTCESVVFYDREENNEYVFGHWLVFYDGDKVYGTKTKGWYLVDVLTGNVSSS